MHFYDQIVLISFSFLDRNEKMDRMETEWNGGFENQCSDNKFHPTSRNLLGLKWSVYAKRIELWTFFSYGINGHQRCLFLFFFSGAKYEIRFYNKNLDKGKQECYASHYYTSLWLKPIKM